MENPEPPNSKSSEARLIELVDRLSTNQRQRSHVTEYLLTFLLVITLGAHFWTVFGDPRTPRDFGSRREPQASQPAAGSINITNTSSSSPDRIAESQDRSPLRASNRFATRLPEPSERATSDEESEPRGIIIGRPARVSKFPKNPGLSPSDQARVDDNCPFGMPKLAPGFPAPTQVVCRDGFVLEHNAIDKIPLWVSERISTDELSGPADRRDRFKPDPLLPSGSRSELADYKNSGFDRGHMAPAGNHKSSQRLNDETFFLSNMSPQAGDLNRKMWAALEDSVRDWARTHGGAHVITGGFFYDPEEDDAATADGIIPHEVIGDNSVAVPTHFYKIVVGKDSSGEAKAIAFVAEHRGYPTPFDFKPLVKPIRWIEDQTGIDFMPTLSPPDADRLETQNGALPGFFGNN